MQLNFNMVAQFKNPPAERFYEMILQYLTDSKIPFLIGGAFAVFHYSGIFRQTKDLDVYCKPSDCNALLRYFSNLGFKTEVTDVRWLAKVYGEDGNFIDIIFSTVNNMGVVDDQWFEQAEATTLFSHEVLVISPEELVRGKLYVQNRERYDGADINHIWLRHGKQLNWKTLSEIIEPHWHLLLGQMISFQFVYPFDFREILPRDIFESLLKRAQEQYEMERPQVRVCLGPLIDQTQYQIDVKKWNYKSYTIKTV